MKLKKLIGGLILSSVLAAGVGVSVASHNESHKETRIVEAATSNFTVGSTVFFRSTLSWWYDASAATYAYFYNDSTSSNYWQKMNYNYFSDNFAWCTVPSGTWSNVIFVRTNGSSGWNNKWNQTSNLSAGSGDCFVVSGGGGDSCTGTWSTFSSQQTWQVGCGSTLTALSYRNDSEGAVFYSTSVSITEDSSLYIHRDAGTGAEGWFKSQYFEEGTNSGIDKGYIKKNGDDQDATVLKSGSLEFYVKMNSQLVWTQVPSSTEADSYAQEFLSIITCNSESVKFTIDKWNEVSGTESVEYKYSQLTTGAKQLLQSAEASQGGSNIEQCAARYDRILSKYGYVTGENDYHDFMGRTPAKSGSGAILINSIVNGSTGSMIAIIAISSVSIAAIGGYFLLKKKKND